MVFALVFTVFALVFALVFAVVSAGPQAVGANYDLFVAAGECPTWMA